MYYAPNQFKLKLTRVFFSLVLRCSDPCEQLAYVAAFTISAYSTTSSRTGKPFNPLLGETYECDRTDDLGWRAISEQVSHHPPMVAQYCEGTTWKCWQEFTMTSKFRGKYLQVSWSVGPHVSLVLFGDLYVFYTYFGVQWFKNKNTLKS